MAKDTSTNLDILEIPEMKVDGLPAVIDDISVAFAIGFRPRSVWWLILHPAAAWRVFQIAKASGKMRTIHAPSEPMDLLSRRIRSVFLLPLVARLGAHVSAYRKGLNTVNAVTQHIQDCPVCAVHDVPHTCVRAFEETATGYRVDKGDTDCVACGQPAKHSPCPRRGVKVHLDLKDFFSNTRASWIREYFMEVVGYSYRVADFLASTMTVRLDVEAWSQRKLVKRTIRGVPQGAPTSGDICNLVADHRLDWRIKQETEHAGWTYTRYADDLYFSHPQNLPAEDVWAMIGSVTKAVVAAGWQINRKKIRIQRPRYQQVLLGATLNRKVNIPKQQYREIRRTIHRCWRDGFDAEGLRHGKSGGQMKHWLGGVVSWFSTLNKAKANRLKVVLEAAKEKHNERYNDAA